MAKRPQITRSFVLSHFEKLPHARATYKQLVKEFNAKGADRVALDEKLEQLISRGDLIEWKTGHFVLTGASKEFISGRLQMHRDGYGFVIPDRPIEGMAGDLFLPPDALEEAMHGDQVLARVARMERNGRAYGEIVRILKRAHVFVVGEFRIQRHHYVVPHDPRVRQWVIIPEGLEKPPQDSQMNRIGATVREVGSVEEMEGMIVNVEILDFPEKGEPPVGRVIEILGYPDDFGVDVEIVIRKHHLRHLFPAAVIAEAEGISLEIPASEVERREDFRGLPIVTIDGETARDFDDAILVERLDNGNFALQVHIADVSHYVRPETAIDHEAALRGTSVYFPDRAVPMLPIELSTNICSLRPNEDRLVLSAIVEIDHQGDVVGQRFAEGIIRSAERMTYTNVQKVLDGDAEQRARYAAFVERFQVMEELALLLNRKRVRRGSIDFDLPEAQVIFDEAGEMTGIERSPRLMANRIIEEFMLTANEAVAGALEAHGVASIYRVHERPDPKKVAVFAELAQSFGLRFGEGPLGVKTFARYERKRDGRKVRKEVTVYEDGGEITSQAYQKLIAQIEGKPEERVLSYQLLRSLKQARYAAENVGHFALAAKSYTHFTSPIRRYPDLQVHRILREWLQGGQPGSFAKDGKTPEPNRERSEELRILADDCSFTERQAAEAERELIEWKKVKFMAEKIGDEFPALVVSTTRFGMFVELEDLFVEGLVPLDAIPSDRFHYEETSRLIVGHRTGLVFRVGDRITVRLDRVDEIEKTMQFALAGEAGKGPRVGGKKLTGARGAKSASASRRPPKNKKSGRRKRR
ncbi:MAG: VacB/RNase II family 3'-5' exoribonuclease [Bryobacterales bacterium]|nr:VacB/RNase II family 3'-5' exoribonuclease [Bryobacterales bacterium]